MIKYFTKTFAFCAAIILSLSVAQTSHAQSCLNTIPFSFADVSSADGSLDTITTCIFLGEYIPVTGVGAGSNFQFSLPNGGYITLREGTFNGPIVGQGSGSANVFNASGLELFVHVNLDDGSCGELPVTCQTLTAQCLSCDGCITTSEFNTASLSGATNSVETLSTCNIAFEYNSITDVPSFSTIEFTTTGGAYITVRAGTFNGQVLGQGFSPVTVFNGFNSELFVHYTADAACSIGGIGCLTTTVQCTSCPFPDPMDGSCYQPNLFNTESLVGATSTPITLETCNFQAEHTEIVGVPVGENIGISADQGTYITVREGASNGPVVAEGLSPVTVFGTSGANLYAHWSANEFCDDDFICVETTATCFTCPNCPDGSFIGDPCDDGNPLTAGSTIQEDCSCGGGGLIPENDTCEGITSLLDCGELVGGSTEFALPPTNSVSGCGFLGAGVSNDVWYAFEANGSDNYVVTLQGIDTFDGVLYVYSGPCGAQTEIACSDGIGQALPETIELIGLASGVYYIQLYAYFSSGEYTVSLDCESSCQNPFPAVDEASLSTVFTGSAFATSWDPVPNQIGCQVQARFAGGSILGAQIVGGAAASGFNIPGSVLLPGTDYEWRVRCGCSQVPLVAGPFSSWQPFSTPGGSTISSLPNPTSGLSNVTFTVSDESYTTLEVFDMSGRLVDAVFTGNAQPNNDYRFEFDGTALPNGVYLYRLTTENEVINDKFMIAK